MAFRRTIMKTGLVLALACAAVGLLAQSARADILADINKRGTVRIATIAGNPPYSSIRPDGTPEGYDIDIGLQFAAALKVKPEWIIVDVPGRITALQTGKADITLANFTATIERSKAIAFTRPYIVVGSNYMVKKDSPLQSVEQVNKPTIKIGVPRGGTAEDIAATHTPNAQVVKFNTVTDAFLALKSGQVDTHILDSLQAAAFLAKEGANFRNLPGNYSYEEISIGLPAGDGDWLRIVDTFVRQLIGSGDDARLFKKYFGYDMPPL